MQIEHQKSTRAAALKNALSAIGVCVLVLPILCLTFRNDEYFWGWLFFAMLFIAFEALLLRTCLRNFIANEHFRCSLSPDQIFCHCPLDSQGDSFKLRLVDIQCIEERRYIEFPSKFFLVDFTGNKYWLTYGYDNPVKKILDGLQSLNPKIEIRDSC